MVGSLFYILVSVLNGGFDVFCCLGGVFRCKQTFRLHFNSNYYMTSSPVSKHINM